MPRGLEMFLLLYKFPPRRSFHSSTFDENIGQTARKCGEKRTRKFAAAKISDGHVSDLADPPSKLIVTGYEEGTTIPAGTVLRLMCTATAGNPLATLTWYKNDRKVRGTRSSRIPLDCGPKIRVFRQFYRIGSTVRLNFTRSHSAHETNEANDRHRNNVISCCRSRVQRGRGITPSPASCRYSSTPPTTTPTCVARRRIQPPTSLCSKFSC